jgi:hypothetical protein
VFVLPSLKPILSPSSPKQARGCSRELFKRANVESGTPDEPRNSEENGMQIRDETRKPQISPEVLDDLMKPVTN